MIWYVVLYFVLCTCLYYFYRANDNYEHNWKDIILRLIISFVPIWNIIVLLIIVVEYLIIKIKENIKPPKPPKWL